MIGMCFSFARLDRLSFSITWTKAYHFFIAARFSNEERHLRRLAKVKTLDRR